MPQAKHAHTILSMSGATGRRSCNRSEATPQDEPKMNMHNTSFVETVMTVTKNKKAVALDPIFALLKAEERTKALWLKEVDNVEKVRDRILEEDKKTAEAGKSRVRLQPCNYRTSEVPYLDISNAYFLGFPADVDQHVNLYVAELAHKLGPKAQKQLTRVAASAKRELKQMLKAHLADHWRRREDCGLTTAEDVYERAEQAHSDAVRTVCECVPTTSEGFIAQLQFLKSELEQDVANNFADGRTAEVFNTLLATAKAFDMGGRRRPTKKAA